MKKFKFKLEAILKLREFKEHEGKMKLAGINQEMSRIKEDIIKNQADIKIAYESLESITEGGVGGHMLSFYPYYIKGKQEFIAKQERLLEDLHLDYEKAVKELAQLRAEVKVVDNMKQKKRDEFNKELKKKQQEDIEDIIQMRRYSQSLKQGV